MFLIKKFSKNISRILPNINIRYSSNIYTELNRDFIKLDNFFENLKKNGIEYFTGVPDSLMKDFLLYLDTNYNSLNNVSANEGTAIAHAVGYNLSTNKIPWVYLQNSGLGNIINPILSLCHEKVYNIPILLFIGWRGEPYKYDEPQHLLQGDKTLQMLALLDIPYTILSDNTEYANNQITNEIASIKKNNNIKAILSRRRVCEEFKSSCMYEKNDNIPMRYSILEHLVKNTDNDNYILVSTTGFTSRELYDINKKYNRTNSFYTVGSMGHCSSIATGIAQYSNKKVLCIDGDGSLIMHMGSLVLNKPNNFIHIFINNNSHESVGGQSTNSEHIDFCKIAEGCGYKTSKINNLDEFEKLIVDDQDNPLFIEIRLY